MITEVDGIIRFKKLFNCSPCLDRYDEVNKNEYEYFINNIIRNYTVMSHCGGVNVYDYKERIVAYRKDEERFYVLKEFIKK